MEIVNQPKITIINTDDEIIGYKARDTVNKEDIYRVSALWITNSQGEILLAKRHHTKSHHPNMWGPAVAGTIDEGETYESNIIKEAKEEIGLRDIKPMFGPKIEITGEYHHFTQWFTLKVDQDIDSFKIQEDEVEKIRWFTPQELKNGLQMQPEEFLPRMNEYFVLFL
jgi:isopentenyldiphosphate isomerase